MTSLIYTIDAMSILLCLVVILRINEAFQQTAIKVDHFSEEVIPAIKFCVEDKYVDDILKLDKLINAILRAELS